MEQTFDVDKFIARIGARLVEQFDDARSATTPSTVGAAMEQPVRVQLEQILPRGIAVGSGFVIDSNGSTSRQTDVVLYERDICPVFSINDTPETTYYPCEGVIAVGEVKSTLDRDALQDAFKKIASVKKLKRYPVSDFMPHPTSGTPIVLERSYGNKQNPSVIEIGEEKEPSESRQILGFIVAGTARMQIDKLLEYFRDFTCEESAHLSPNLAVLLDGGLLTWGNITNRHFEKYRSEKNGTYGMREVSDGPAKWKSSWSAQNAHYLRHSEDTEAFRALIRHIYEIYRTGKTSDVRAFDRYFHIRDRPVPSQIKYIPRNDIPL